MAKYPSNFNDPLSSLSYDTVIERQTVQDNVDATGLSNLSQTTEPIGDMFKALGMLEVEIDNLKKSLLHTSLPVAVATTTVLPGTVTYNNGTLGVGATIVVADAPLGTIDGYTVVAGDRILVKNQAAPAQNGIYIATTLGGGNYTLTRTADLDQSAEFLYNVAVTVTAGTTNAGRQYKNTSADTPTIGTTSISFGQITPIGTSQAGVYTVTALGGGGAPWVLTRTTDSDEAADYAAGLSVQIASGGASNGGKWFKNTNTSSITMGTTSITWSEFTSVNGSRPFPNNAVFPTNERTYFANVYGSKLKQVQNEAINLARKLKKMEIYMSKYTGAAGDQTPAANVYPSAKNRGY